MRIEAKLQELGLILPEQMQTPEPMRLPFVPVRIRGNRAYISGAAPLAPDGSMAQPLGKVGADITVEQGYQAARLVALAHLGSLKRALGDLDRVTAWLRVFGMVNVAPGFTQTPLVINGYSDLILELYGSEAGPHARSAVGLAELPFSIPVEIEAEVEVDGEAR
jgi:enamine deaminase RidA (YjgF/YER057c/UK114 family)